MSEPRDTASDPPVEDEVARTIAEAVAAVGAVHAGRPAGSADDPEIDELEIVDGDPIDEPVDVPDPQAEIAAARAEVFAIRDKWIRAVADHENYKKRVKRDVDEAVHRAVSRLLEDFLVVPDNLERALDAAKSEDSQLVAGIRMVMSSFMGALMRHGIRPVETVGCTFDPAVHDALQQIDSPDHAPGIVIQEFEKGFIKDERLLRPARVVVAGAGSTGIAVASERGRHEGDADEAGAT